MAKRLQVILQDRDYKAIQRAARSGRMSVAAWVRRALEAARREQPSDDVERKLEALRVAVQYQFPAPDIKQINAEIEAGYLSDRSVADEAVVPQE